MAVELLRTFAAWTVIFPVIFLAGSSFRFMIQTKDMFLRGILYYALGLALLSYSMLLLSLLHLLTPLAIWGILIFFALIRFRKLREWVEWLKVLSLKFQMRGKSWQLKTLDVVFILSFAALLLGTLSPEIGGDALVYHLNLSKVFLSNHSITPLYYDINSYFPLLMNNLFLIGLATGGVFAAKLFHFLCGYLLFLAVDRIIQLETKNSTLALFMALVLWLTPTFYNMLSTTYVDIALAFYVFVGLCTLIAAFEEKKNWSFFLGGLLIGFAMSIKYLAMMAFSALLAVWIFETVKERKIDTARVRSWMIWMMGFAAGCGFWLIRNWILTKNPLFPYFAHLFGTEPYMEVHYDIYGIGKGIFDFISIFFTMFYFPSSFGDFGSRIGVFYFLFLPFIVLAAIFVPKSRSYSVFSLFFLIAWFYVCQYHRYVLPVLPAIIVAAGLGVHWGLEAVSRNLKVILNKTAIPVAFCLLAVYFCGGIYHYRYSYLLYLGRWTPEEYLTKMERTLPIARWCNHNLPAEAKILFESEIRQFYFNRPIVRDIFLNYRTHHATTPKTMPEISQFLKSIGITHLLIAYPKGGIQNSQSLSLLKKFAASSFADKLFEVSSENIRDQKFVYELYKLR